MKRVLLWACAMALALFPAPVFAQAVINAQLPVTCNPGVDCKQATPITNPDGTYVGAVTVATSTPCSAVVTTSAVTPTGCSASFTSGTATIGGFAPQLGRNLRVLITGTWAGTVTVGTSTNSTCSTFNPLTIGGSQWGVFTGNANEFVDTPSVATAYYCIQATVTSGSPTVSLLQ